MPPRTWNDDDLRRAITSATSWSDVIRELGLVDSGNVRGQLRVAAGRLGIDVTHLELRRRERWTDAELIAAVADATNLHGVFGALGLRVGGGAWLRIQEHIHRLQLDTSHWRDGPLEPRSLRGQGWWAGETRPPRPARPLSEVLIHGSTIGSSKLRERLLREGVFDARCVRCGLETWLGEPIPLQLDHIDGDRTNNQVGNLRLLCPTCHALTDTYCGRNIRRR